MREREREISVLFLERRTGRRYNWGRRERGLQFSIQRLAKRQILSSPRLIGILFFTGDMNSRENGLFIGSLFILLLLLRERKKESWILINGQLQKC